MLVTLSTTTADLAGHLELPVNNDSTDGETRRRVTRIATLDGGAVVNDGGYSAADRVLEFAWVSDSATREAAVRRLIELYHQVVAATRDGVYLVALESYTPGAAESTLRALVLQKLDD